MNKFLSEKKPLLLIIILGAILRFYNLNMKCFDTDEFYDFTFAQQNLNFSNLLFYCYQPLNLYILKIILFFTNNIFWFRFVACFFGIFSIYFVYKIAKHFFSEKIALLSCLFFSLSSINITFSHYMRFYNLSLFLVLVSIYYFLNICYNAKNNKNIVFYLISSSLFLYSNHFCYYIIFIENLYFLLLYYKNSIQIKKWFKLQFFLFLISFPALYLFVSVIILRYLELTGGGICGDWACPSKYGLLNSLNVLSIGYGFSLIIADKFARIMMILAFPIFGIAFFNTIILLFKNHFKNFTKEKWGIIFLYSLLFLMVILFFISRTIVPIYRIRYFLIGAFSYYILIALGAMSLKNNFLRNIIISLLIIFSLFGTIRDYKINTFSYSYREIIKHIEKDNKDGTILVMPCMYFLDIFKYYYKGNKKIIGENFVVPQYINKKLYWEKKFKEIKMCDKKRIYLITAPSLEESDFIEIADKILGKKIEQIEKIGQKEVGKNSICTIKTYVF